jgi:hypothetical protein
MGDGIATRIQTGRFVVRFPEGPRDIYISSPYRRDQVWALLANENGSPLPGLKQLGQEFDPSPPSTAEVKNKWSYTSNTPMCLHSVDKKIFKFLVISL